MSVTSSPHTSTVKSGGLCLVSHFPLFDGLLNILGKDMQLLFMFTESQNWSGWKYHSGAPAPASLFKQGHPKNTLYRLCPDGFSERKTTISGQSVPVHNHPHSKELLHVQQRASSAFCLFLPVASCPIDWHHHCLCPFDTNPLHTYPHQRGPTLSYLFSRLNRQFFFSHS